MFLFHYAKQKVWDYWRPKKFDKFLLLPEDIKKYFLYLLVMDASISNKSTFINLALTCKTLFIWAKEILGEHLHKGFLKPYFAVTNDENAYYLHTFYNQQLHSIGLLPFSSFANENFNNASFVNQLNSKTPMTYHLFNTEKEANTYRKSLQSLTCYGNKIQTFQIYKPAVLIGYCSEQIVEENCDGVSSRSIFFTGFKFKKADKKEIKLSQKNPFIKEAEKFFLFNHRHDNATSQHEFDKQFGLTLR